MLIRNLFLSPLQGSLTTDANPRVRFVHPGLLQSDTNSDNDFQECRCLPLEEEIRAGARAGRKSRSRCALTNREWSADDGSFA